MRAVPSFPLPFHDNLAPPISVISISNIVFFPSTASRVKNAVQKKMEKNSLFSSSYFKALTKKSGRIAGSSPKDAMMSLKVTEEAVPFAQTAKVNGSFFTSVLNTVPDFKVWSPLALKVWEFPSVQQENLWSKGRK